MLAEPSGKPGGEVFRIDSGKEFAKHAVSGDLVEALRSSFQWQEQVFALSLRELRGVALDLGDVPAARHQGHGRYGQDRSDAKARVAGSRVGNLAKGVVQGLHFARLEGKRSGGGVRMRGGEALGKGGTLQNGAGIVVERTNPQLLGAVVGNVEVRPVATVAGARSDGFPVAGFVASARVGFWVGEAFGQHRSVAEAFVPLLLEGSERGAHRLGGEVGVRSLGRKNEEAAILDDEFESLHALLGVPSDPMVAILERVACWSPDEQSDEIASQVDGLPKVVAYRLARSEVMVFSEESVELGDFVLAYDLGAKAHRLVFVSA